MKFDSNGGFITAWGSEGNGDGQLNNPYGITTDNAGRVYVADTRNNRIEMFDSNGHFIAQWGGFGTGDGQFSLPSDVAVDDAGHLILRTQAITVFRSS